MRVVLVNPPKSEHDQEEIAPPLGLLRLARVTQGLGATVYVEDYNLLWHLDERLRSAFYEEATERLLALDADVYGFTSMAVDSHVGLELARRVKQAKPEAIMIVGGPHFSSIAESIPDAFPWIDHVVRGEGELPFHDLLRERLGRPHAPEKPVVDPLYEAVRFPAYFHVNPARRVDFEAGRGCRFKCAFCYSPEHYASFRYFDIDHVIDELAKLSSFGARHVWLVEDNFLNDPDRAVNLCYAIEQAKLGLTWSCYATFPQISPHTIEAMARAGCTEVFSGIDAVGNASERSFHKAFLRGKTPLEVKTRRLIDAGITPTYAFLVAPPSHPAGRDITVTVTAALEARVAGAEVLLNPLTLYSGTPSLAAFQCARVPDALQVQLMMDVPDVVEQNPFVAQRPELFPFHSRYVGAQEWQEFLSLAHCLSTLLSTYPRTLTRLDSSRGIHPVRVAQETLERFNGWIRLKAVEHRQVEQDVGFFVLEALAAGSPAAAVLDEERTSCSHGESEDLRPA